MAGNIYCFLCTRLPAKPFIFYVFIWLCQILAAAHRTSDLQGVQDPVIVVCRILSYGMHSQLWHVRSSSPTRD